MFKTLGEIRPKKGPLNIQFGVIDADLSPDLCLAVAKIFGLSSQMDAAKGRIMATLLSAERVGAISVYFKLRSAQRSAIEAAAESKLGKDELTIFHKVMKKGKSFDTVRNHLAHFIWATSKELPDWLLLQNPTNEELSAAHFATVRDRLGAGILSQEELMSVDLFKHRDTNEMKCYNTKALNDVLERGAQALNYLRALTLVCDQNENNPNATFPQLEAALHDPEELFPIIFPPEFIELQRKARSSGA